MSSIIQRLPDDLINQIAAGEVIENPASVVKELVENSIDAKSSSIEIRVYAGGLQQIIISDNGSGMSAEDAALCFERHATSKLKKFNDLWALSTMGFRGEALAAIASISKIVLTTSCETPKATKVIAEGSKILKIEPASRQRGTTIEVHELFYNTPARKSFQKSTSNSFSQIYKLIGQFSLAYPEIEFTLYNADQKALFIHGSSKETSLLEQLEEKGSLLLEEPIKDQFLPLEIHKEHYSMTGWLGKPEVTKHNRQSQHLFINQRAVQCSFIQAILKQAYGTLIDGKKYPVCILHIKIDPTMIDINVHPQKKEIRFREDWKIQRNLFEDFESALLGPVRIQTLLESPEPTTPPTSLGYQAYLSSSFTAKSRDELFRTTKPSTPLSGSLSGLSNQEENPWKPIPASVLKSTTFCPEISKIEAVVDETRQMLDSLPIGKVRKVHPIGLFDTYLLLNAEASELPLQMRIDSGILFIDLIRLQEMKTLLALKTKNPIQQRLLLPVPVTLRSPPDESLLHKLEEFGFSARILGKNSLVIEAIPEVVSLEIAEELFLFLAESIQENNSTSSVEQKLLKAYDGKLTRNKRFSMAEAIQLWEWALSLPQEDGKRLWKAAISFIPKGNIKKSSDQGGSFERIF